jgi:hypothetical protein
MKAKHLINAALACALSFTSSLVHAAISADASAKAGDPLPSWNDGNAKQSITAFV